MKEALPIREGAWGFIEQVLSIGASPIAHTHDELELNLVTRGEAVYLIEGRRVRLVRGTLLKLSPGWEHLLVDASKDFHMWIIVTRSRSSLPGPECMTLAGPIARLLGELCRELYRTPSVTLLNAGLELCLELVQKHASNAPSAELGPAVHPGVLCAAQQLHRSPDATLRELAALTRMSASRLGRLFKSQMGVPLSRYRNRIRLQRAQQKLDQPHANALHVALESGFGSYAQFYRVFREETGLNPRAARQR